MILADKIITLRKKNDWSQEELAAKLNVSRQAVSKWESAQSIPDITRILDMSKLFDVSVDYLIKDELELDELPSKKEETGRSLRVLTLEDAQQFMAHSKEFARGIAFGVWLCILAAIPLGISIGIFGKWLDDEFFGYLLFVGAFLMIACAVSIFIVSSFKFREYAWIHEEAFDMAYGVEGVIKESLAEFLPRSIRNIVLGVGACMASAMLFAGIKLLPRYTSLSGVGIFASAMVVVSFGVFLFVYSGIIRGSYTQLLQEEEYTCEQKKVMKTFKPFIGFFWALVVVFYVVLGLITNRWDKIWIIWPVAGILSAAVYPLLGFVYEKKYKL